jgi:hypothetical protein
MKHLCFALLPFLVSCASVAAPFKAKLPSGEDWYLGFFAPPYMEAWMERVDVEDAHGLYYSNILAGTTATSWQEDPGGWPKPMQVPMGKGRSITGSALPKRIFVRWQSLVEPQTYRITLDISELVREQMVKKIPYPKYPKELAYQDLLAIELTPGGWVKAWIRSSVSTPVEILCQKAEVEPLGAYQGRYNGQYVKLNGETKEYIRTHSIPYESWNCPERASLPQ